MNRLPALRGIFYPETLEECQRQIKKYTSDSLEDFPQVKAGIVPHAGWSYSGNTAGKVFRAISQNSEVETFVIFGAVHVRGVSKACIWRSGSWETPLGKVSIAQDVCEQLLDACPDIISDQPSPHLGEHSIEVEIPFIQHFFPEAQIVPIMVAPFADAVTIGKKLADVVSPNNTIVLASTDLTHYGERFGFAPKGIGESAHQWVTQENDKRMIDFMLNLEAGEIIPEAERNWNACGAGAVAATLQYAKQIQLERSHLLDYTTSYQVNPHSGVDSFVGYTGIIYS